jgi:hypothetical protein
VGEALGLPGLPMGFALGMGRLGGQKHRGYERHQQDAERQSQECYAPPTTMCFGSFCGACA